jgi:hypothetical protein
MKLMMRGTGFSIGVSSALALLASPTIGPAAEPRNFFPPWEGSGVFVFGPLLLDLNRRQESYSPTTIRGLKDCSTKTHYCLTSRPKGKVGGEMAIALPIKCADFAIGQSWSIQGVTTTVLGIERPARERLSHHFTKPDQIIYLGDSSNPEVVYEYWGTSGVVAIYQGLLSHPRLVDDVRAGLNPETLKRGHRMSLITFDRFAPCKGRVQ